MTTSYDFGSSSQGFAASWDTTLVRYFLLDYDGGNDANVGYVDAAGGADISASVSGRAKKTVAGLLSVLPRVGDGRMAIILIKARSGADKRYYKADGTTADDLVIDVVGYNYLQVRGSSDLSNNAADKRLPGTIAVAGPNGDSSWTVGALTNLTATVSAGTLPTDASLNGRRSRIVSGARTNGITEVFRGIDTTNLAFATSTLGNTVPQVGDSFWVEQPAVWFKDIYVSHAEIYTNTLDPAGSARSTWILGLRATNALMVSNATRLVYVCFCEAANASSFTRCTAVTVNGSFGYNDEVGSFYPNPGLRHESGSIRFWQIGQLALAGSAFVSTSAVSIVEVERLQVNTGVFFKVAPTMTGAFSPVAALGSGGSASQFGGGNGTTTQFIWVDGPGSFGGFKLYGSCEFINVDINNLGALPAFIPAGLGCSLAISGIKSTNGGNTGVAVDLTQGRDCLVVCEQGAGGANTLSPSGGEIKLGDGTIVTWASTRSTDYQDQYRNKVIGTALARYRRMLDGTEDIPALTADPAAPPAGFVRRYYRSDTNQLCVINSSGTVKRSGVFT
jgi:hypothetical protein